jgi:hypothetical protein
MADAFAAFKRRMLSVQALAQGLRGPSSRSFRGPSSPLSSGPFVIQVGARRPPGP